jgi:demethylspheroidene O-methyltransferase
LKIFQSLRRTLLRHRDRLLTSPNFQRTAFRFPIMRWVAGRRMRALFDLCSGFVYSQVLLACVRLRLLEILDEAPQSAGQLADHLDLPRASLDRLLEAAESLQLIEQRALESGAGRFGLGPLGAALLGNPSVARMIEHHSAFYADLHDPIALMRSQGQGSHLSRFWAYSGNASPDSLGSTDTSPYSELMAASQAMIAEQVLSSYPVHKHRCLLDVGGGAGAFVAEALCRNPHLEARVFDLPSVAALAEKRFEELGLGLRGSATGGSFLSDALPSGHDLITLVRILHDHNDEAAMTVLRAVRQAIPADGRLVVAEPLLDTPGAERVGAAYFGFYLMAMGQGRARKADEIRSMLNAAGFDRVREHRTTAPLLTRVLSARPAGRLPG